MRFSPARKLGVEYVALALLVAPLGLIDVFGNSVAVAAAPDSFAAQEMQDVEIETVPVADGIYMLVGQGGNIGVSIGEDGAILIDDQFAPLTDKIVAAVGALTDKPILFIINTHWHRDHTGGNENMGERGAIIVAHENVRRRMSTEQFIEFFDTHVPPSPDMALPVVTFTDAVTLHFNGEEIHVFHVDPAHTDGDSIIHFRKANAMHMGDLFFSNGYPFIDLSSGGSVDGVIGAAEKAGPVADGSTRIIPGHGPLSDAVGLRRYHDMLATIRGRIRELVARGATLEEVIAARPTREYDEFWGQGSRDGDTFAGLVYQSLSGEQ